MLANSSPLVGTSVREASFRQKYHGGVLGVHREGVRAPLPAIDTTLQAGDVLLLGAPGDWGENNKHNANFSMVNKVPNSNPPKKSRGLLAIGLGLSLVIVQVSNALGVNNAARFRVNDAGMIPPPRPHLVI